MMSGKNYHSIAHGTRCEEPGCDEGAVHIVRNASDFSVAGDAWFYCEEHPAVGEPETMNPTIILPGRDERAEVRFAARDYEGQEKTA